MNDVAEQGVATEQAPVEISLSVRVSNPEALRNYMRRRYAACWFDHEWEPADVAESVLEALVISNENPPPDEYGIEIIKAEAKE